MLKQLFPFFQNESAFVTFIKNKVQLDKVNRNMNKKATSKPPAVLLLLANTGLYPSDLWLALNISILLTSQFWLVYPETKCPKSKRRSSEAHWCWNKQQRRRLMVKFGSDPKWLAIAVIRSTNFPPLLLAEMKCIVGCDVYMTKGAEPVHIREICGDNLPVKLVRRKFSETPTSRGVLPVPKGPFQIPRLSESIKR